MKKKIMAIIMALALMISIISTPVQAAEVPNAMKSFQKICNEYDVDYYVPARNCINIFLPEEGIVIGCLVRYLGTYYIAVREYEGEYSIGDNITLTYYKGKKDMLKWLDDFLSTLD